MQSANSSLAATEPRSDTASRPVTSRELSTAFGSNAIRLRLGHWSIVVLLVGIVLWGVPRWWKRTVPFDVAADYRVPYQLSRDYWTYSRWVETAATDRAAIFLVGDSVVWGEYVTPANTLAGCLNRLDPAHYIVNAGLNGTHPLALEGLVRYYAKSLHDRAVILHCNLLWMSSPERDLQVTKEVDFNHPDLIPQLRYQIPAYRANAENRLGIIVDRHSALRGLLNHLRIAYFEGQDWQNWSIEHPYANPLQRIRMQVRRPDDAPHSRPIPWTERGMRAQDMPWVQLESSYQWQATMRTIRLLRQRGNRLFVIVGPFNEHMLTAASRRRYAELRHQVTAWLGQNSIPYFAPEPLASSLYGDASHPLAAGYDQIARSLQANTAFRHWWRTTVAMVARSKIPTQQDTRVAKRRQAVASRLPIHCVL